jgi:hypothetical protein
MFVIRKRHYAHPVYYFFSPLLVMLTIGGTFFADDVEIREYGNNGG